MGMVRWLQETSRVRWGLAGLAVVGVTAFACFAFVYFCEGPTGWYPRHEHGFGAFLEQVGLGIILPSAFVLQTAIVPLITGGERSSFMEAETFWILVPLLLIQFWPVYAFTLGGWSRLNGWVRWGAAAYAVLLVAAMAAGFFLYRSLWDGMFGP